MSRVVPGPWSLAVVVAFWSIDAAAGPENPPGPPPEGARWVVVQPGYPGSTEDAEGFMESFSEYIAKKAELPNVRGVYHNVPEQALAAIRSSHPAFSLVSLGFYLEHRRKLGLVPLLESEPQDRFVIVALEGTVAGPEALRGAKVAGGPLFDRAFLERVVFRGKAPVASWQAEPELRPSRALRRLDRGSHAAVVLTGREFEAFGALSRRKKLEKILESAYYPESLLVYFSPERREEKPSREKTEEQSAEKSEEQSAGKSKSEEKQRPGEAPDAKRGASGLSEEQRLRLERAFLSLSKDAEGKELLKTMGIGGFVAVRSEWLKGMEGSFDAEEKK